MNWLQLEICFHLLAVLISRSSVTVFRLQLICSVGLNWKVQGLKCLQRRLLRVAYSGTKCRVSVESKQHFGGTSIFNLQNRRNSVLLDIGSFDLKNTGGMLLRNVGWLLEDYTALCPIRYDISELETVHKRRVRRKQFIY
jgi:hypothetical protein